VKTATGTAKIQTLDVSSPSVARQLAGGRALVDVGRSARQNAFDLGILRRRSEIEEEIRKRQDWQTGPATQLPPPTTTGGSAPPSLPAGGAGQDREPPPPPTQILPEKPPKLPETKSLALAQTDLPVGKPGLPVELVSLRFFEHGGRMPAQGERQYSTHFSRVTARFVNLELTMRMIQESVRSTRVRVKTHFLNPDGGLFKWQEEDYVVYADTDSRPYQWGFGAAQPGFWRPGNYRVVIFINGVQFAKEAFTITDAEARLVSSEEPSQIRDWALEKGRQIEDQQSKPLPLGHQIRDWALERGSLIKAQPPLSPGNPQGSSDTSRQTSNPTLHLQPRSLIFYESGKGFIGELSWRVSTHFPQQSARYINIVLQTWNVSNQDLLYYVVYRCYKPDGCLLGEAHYDWRVPAGSFSPCNWGGLGWDDPGHWQPGAYRVEVFINETLFTEGSFTIEEARGWEQNARPSLPPARSPALQPLLFYEGAVLLERYQRRYSTHFPQSARFINYDLTRTDAQSREVQSRQVEQRYIYPDGTVQKTTPPDGHIEEWLSSGIGKSTGGSWQLGTYRVEILIDRVQFAEGTFTVEPGEISLPDTRCERVVFSDKAYQAVIAETYEHLGRETGGDLLGHRVDGVWYVLETVDPGPNAVHNPSTYAKDHPYVKHVINKTARLYKHGLELLGCWHVHPSGSDTFSSADDAVNTNYVSRCESSAISGLVNHNPEFRLTMYHVTLPLHYTKVSVQVGDSLIPKDMFAVRSIKEFWKKG
jgi:proteasome lid subunit RPN8/RPN11